MTASTPIADRLPPLHLPDLSTTRAVVTGASAGIGLHTAEALARAGADVVLAVRNPTKGEAAAERIRQNVPQARLAIEQVELGSLASISAFAERIAGTPVNLLVNNAGLSAANASELTEDGFDLQVGVNYLGAYALTCGLWSALEAGCGRVVMLGSLMAARGQITPELGRPTGSTVASYSNSKLAAVVLAQELRRRCHHAGSSVSAVAAHPGWSQTAIFANGGPPAFLEALGGRLGWIQSPADGAQPILLAATAVQPAPYYGPIKRRGLAGVAGPVPLPKPARPEEAGIAASEIAQRLTGCSLAL